MKCQFCGTELFVEKATFCPHCGHRLNNQQYKPIEQPSLTKNSSRGFYRKPWFWIIVVIVITALVFAIVKARQCSVSGCHNPKADGSDYCTIHTCAISTCNRKRTNGIYCYYHSLDYGNSNYSGSSTYKLVADWQLEISGVTLSESPSFTYAEGKLTNNSTETVRFVRIRGAFKTSSGTVVDTGWGYAVGSEGLAPGETTKWRITVTKDYTISKCDVSIYDYDY